MGSITEVDDTDLSVVRDIMSMAARTYAVDRPIRPVRVVLGSWETLARGGREEWRYRLARAIQQVAEEEQADSRLSVAPWLIDFEESERPEILSWVPGSWDGLVSLWLYDKEDTDDCGRGYSFFLKLTENDWAIELGGENVAMCLDAVALVREIEASEVPFSSRFQRRDYHRDRLPRGLACGGLGV